MPRPAGGAGPAGHPGVRGLQRHPGRGGTGRRAPGLRPTDRLQHPLHLLRPARGARAPARVRAGSRRRPGGGDWSIEVEPAAPSTGVVEAVAAPVGPGPPPLGQPDRGRAPAAGDPGGAAGRRARPSGRLAGDARDQRDPGPAAAQAGRRSGLRQHGPEARQRRRRVGGARPPRPRSWPRRWPVGAVTWVKVVVGPDTDPDEFDAGIAMVAAGVDRCAPTPVEVFLQPLTPFGDGRRRHPRRTGARAAGPGAAHPPPGAGRAPDPQGHRPAVADRPCGTGPGQPDRRPARRRGGPGRPRTAPRVGTTWPW